MPEGPEVKRIAKALQRLEGKIIAKAEVVSGRYKRGIHDLERLSNVRLEAVLSKGKLLTLQVKNATEPFAILSTMGMTGWWVILDKPDHEWDKHRRIELQFSDGTVAAFFDPRNFGTFKVVSYTEAKRKQAELGPDILTESDLWSVAIPEFTIRMKRFGKNQNLAEALLDQRISSGCGNYIRADAMYLARMSPFRAVSKMTDSDIRRIWVAMHFIGTASSLNEAPPIELNEHGSIIKKLVADEFQNLCYHGKETPTGGVIENYTDSDGRTVWYSPKEQV